MQFDGADVASRKFWSRVLVGAPDMCWPWTKELNSGGYGRTNPYLGPDVGRLAHRIAFALTVGRAPNGEVRQSCGNHECCNPAHLREGTAQDRGAAARARGTMSRGLNHFRGKLSDDDVRELRAFALAGWSDKELASIYGISPVTAQQIRTRVRRGSVT